MLTVMSYLFVQSRSIRRLKVTLEGFGESLVNLKTISTSPLPLASRTSNLEPENYLTG